MIDTTMPRDCQAERPRKGYTYLHLTAARMHDQPPGLPLLQPLCMHWTYVFIAFEIQNQHPLRAGRPGSILTSPDTRMHVGEMSRICPREEGSTRYIVDLLLPVPSLIDK
jgi:hypothetical protein